MLWVRYILTVSIRKGTVANPYNLVENSSFERGTDYWSFSGITNSDGIVSPMDMRGHGFKIQNDSYGYKEIYQTIPVKGMSMILHCKCEIESQIMSDGRRPKMRYHPWE